MYIDSFRFIEKRKRNDRKSRVLSAKITALL